MTVIIRTASAYLLLVEQMLCGHTSRSGRSEPPAALHSLSCIQKHAAATCLYPTQEVVT